MDWQTSLHLLPPLISFFMSAGIGFYALSRSVAGSKPFGYMVLLQAGWILGFMFELVNPSLAGKVFWDNIQWAFAVFVPLAFLSFTVQYTASRIPYSQIVFRLLYFLAAVFLLFVYTNDFHGLMLHNIRLAGDAPNTALVYDFSPLLLGSSVLFYLVFLLGAANLVVHFFNSQEIVRSQVLAVFLGGIIPLIGSIFTLMDIVPASVQRDISPYTFVVGNLLIGWALFRYRMLDITPMARNVIFESMMDGFAVLSDKNIVMDLNPAAARILGLSGVQAVGRPARDVFMPWSKLVESLETTRDETKEVFIVGTGEGQRNYVCFISPLNDRLGRFMGRVVTIRRMGESVNYPLPSLAKTAAEAQPPPGVEPANRATEKTLPLKRLEWFDGVVQFFFPPLRANLPIPPGREAIWYRTLERTLTTVLRLGFILVLLTFISLKPLFQDFPAAYTIFQVLVAVLGILGIFRRIPFEIRSVGFVSIFYLFGIIETLIFGFTAESFVFFMVFAVSVGTLAWGRTRRIALTVSFVSIAVLGGMIASIPFIPLAGDRIHLAAYQSARLLPTMISLAGGLMGLTLATTSIWETARRVWRKERQTSNLMKQERDLLEIRVQERTRDLAEAEEKYRQLVEQLPMVVYQDQPDFEGTSIYLSPQIEWLLGYPMSEWKDNPSLWQSILHPEDREIANSGARHVLEKGQGSIEYRVFNKQGNVVWLRDDAVLLRDEAGKPKYVQGTLSDVTARTLALKRQHETEKMMMQVMENLNEVFWVSDPFHKEEIYLSPSAEKIWGRPASELVDSLSGFFSTIVKEDLPTVLDAYEKESRGEGMDIKYRILRPDGTMRWVWERSFAIFDDNGRVDRVAGFTSDITDLKQAEDQLRVSEERYRLIYENMEDVVYQTDYHGIITAISPSVTRQAGYSPEELIGQHAGSFYESAEEFNALDALIVQKGTLNDHEVCIRKKDGNIAYVSMTIRTIFDALGNPVGTEGVMRDVSERKKAQDILDRKNRILSALNRTSLELMHHLELKDVFRNIVEQAIQLMDTLHGYLYLVDETQDELVEEIGTGIFKETEGFRLKRGEGLSGKVLETGQPLVVADYHNWDQRSIKLDNLEFHAIVGVPLAIASKVVGVLGLAHLDPVKLFTEEDVELLTGFAQLASIALDNARLHDLVQKELTARNEAENTLRRLTDNMQDVVTQISAEGNILYASPSHKWVLGVDPIEVLGCSIFDRIHPDDLDEAFKILSHAYTEARPPELFALRYQHASGRYVWMECSSNLLTDSDGQFAGAVLSSRDVTQRKEIETALLESEKNYRDLYESNPLMLFSVAFDGTTINVNESAVIQLEYPKDELIGHPVLDVFHPEDREIVRATFSEFVENPAQIRPWEFRKITRSGRIIWVSEIAQLVYDAQGNPMVLVVCEDITKRKEIEAALRENERLYRLLAENSSDVIWVRNMNLQPTYISPAVQRLRGFTVEEAMSATLEETLTPESAIYARKFFANILLSLNDIPRESIRNDYRTLELEMLKKDGSTVWTETQVSFLLDEHGEPNGILGVTRDITERRRAANKLRHLNADLESRVNERTVEIQESNKYLSALLDTAIVLNKNLDLDNLLDHIMTQAHAIVACRAVNLMLIQGEYAYIARRLGYKGLEEIERNLLEYRFPLTWPNFDRMIRTESGIHINDTRNEPTWQKIESSEWVKSYIGLPLLAGSKVIGFLNFSHNEPNFFPEKEYALLEAFANQASVSIQNARLLEEVKRSLEKEQDLRDKLVSSEKLAALGKMVAVIAHEINNPIQTVKNTFYLLQDQVPPDSLASEFVKIASMEATRISNLVNQLRETYRPNSKKLILVDVPRLINDVHQLMMPQFSNSGVEYVIHETDQPCLVMGYPDSLKQVFINMCMNAVEAMSANKGGRITVGYDVKLEDNWLGVSFHNTGPAIPRGALYHIFEPFFTTKGSGSGLGLSICFDIVKQHSGEITVENSTEGGVKFTVWLPLASVQEQDDARQK